MNRRLVSVIFCIALLPLAFAFKKPPVQKKGIQTIIIDPGHGGKDQGAKGLVTTEAKICLDIGLKLGKAIEEAFPHIKVLYTRTTDIIPGNKPDKNQGLRYRAEFANQSSGDLFIAIHCNSNGRKPGGQNERRIVDYTYKKVWTGKGSKRKQVTRKYPVYKYYWVENTTRGTETYIWAADRSDDKMNVINAESDDFSGENDSTIIMPDLNDPVMKAFQLLYQKKYFQSSLILADFVEKEFITAGRVSRGVKQRNEKGIWVLQATGMPSILIETGFITNKEEEQYLNSHNGQVEIVGNIINALRSYIAKFDKPQANGNTDNNKVPPSTTSKADAAILTKKEPIKGS